MITEVQRFIIVVQEGSVTNAANKLFITQPALSQSIKRLEEELDIVLFKHVGKRLVLTKDGEFALSIGLKIIKLWEKAKDPIVRNRGTRLPYSIGLFDNAALKLSSYFQKHLSGNTYYYFEITIDRTAKLMNDMQSGLYDVCICVFKEDTILPKNIYLVKKISEELLPVSGKKWQENISEIPFILYNKTSTTRNYIDKVFLKNGIIPNSIVEATDPNFMKELAISGAGVALLPKNFVKRELTQKKLFIQKFPFIFQREIGVFLNKEGSLKESDQIVKEIVNHLS